MEIRANFLENERLSQLASNLFIMVMLACAGISVQNLIARMAPDYDAGYLLWLAVLASGEALYSQRQAAAYPVLSADWIKYRLSELIVLVLLLKIFFFLVRGLEFFLAEVSAYATDFLSTFFSGEYGWAFLYMLVFWILATSFGQDLGDLGGDLDILKPGARPNFFADRSMVRRRMAGNIFFLGALVVVLTAVTRADSPAIWQEIPLVQSGSLNVIVYFVTALLFLSQGQFSVLRARWGWDRAVLSGELGRAWLKYTLLFFAVLIPLIGVLPTGYTLGVLESLSFLFELLFRLLSLLFFLILFPILWILSLFTPEVSDQVRRQFAPPAQPFAPETNPQTGVPFWDAVRSIVFWLAFVSIAAYAFIQFARQNEDLWARLERIPGFGFFAGLLSRFMRWLKGSATGAVDLISNGLAQLRSGRQKGAGVGGWGFLRINRLDPRSQIRFFYQALLRRTREVDLVRRPAETPEEFSLRLLSEYPEARQEIDRLTGDFETARYSRDPITPEKARRYRREWQSFRRLLRGRGRNKARD